jgi:hypothetical protein
MQRTARNRCDGGVPLWVGRYCLPTKSGCRWNGKKERCAAHINHDFSLSRANDQHFEAERDPIKGREDLNKRVLTLLARFCGETDLSFAKGASIATRQFITGLLEIGSTLPSPTPCIDEQINVRELLVSFTDKTIAQEMVNVADRDFDRRAKEASNDHFINLATDTGSVLKFKAFHCLITNPFRIDRPIVLDVYENDKLSDNSSGTFQSKPGHDSDIVSQIVPMKRYSRIPLISSSFLPT